MCKTCKENPVIIIQGNKPLCKGCFMKYFEKKVFWTIRQYNLIDKKDIIAVGVSGGKDSLTLLYLLNKVLTPQKTKFFGLLIDEGIKGYRNITIEDAKKFCKENGIELKIISYKKEFGNTLDEMLKQKKINACALCGVLRRYLINKYARKYGATKIATGHNLDDEAQSILMNQLKGNMAFSAKLGPKTGVLTHDQFIPRIKPLYFLTEKETTTFSKLKNLPVTFIECPNHKDSFRDEVGKMLSNLEAKYPGTKQSVVNSLLQVLPSLAKQFKGQKIGTCKKCKEPAAKDLCKVCELLKR
ncbi:MAG: TIGR00269 family protein [Candidatus Nanoarchaeia archaeon]|nr:TIGR00269 family protein [Candidatus Nanoarchaeia archaeon]